MSAVRVPLLVVATACFCFSGASPDEVAPEMPVAPQFAAGQDVDSQGASGAGVAAAQLEAAMRKLEEENQSLRREKDELKRQLDANSEAQAKDGLRKKLALKLLDADQRLRKQAVV